MQPTLLGPILHRIAVIPPIHLGHESDNDDNAQGDYDTMSQGLSYHILNPRLRYTSLDKRLWLIKLLPWAKWGPTTSPY